jgi:integrase
MWNGAPRKIHDLRHSHVAALIAQGEHPKVIQTRLGHSSIKITLDRYGHLFDGLDEAAAERLNDSLVAHLTAAWARPGGNPTRN